MNKQYQEIAEHNFGTLLNFKNNTTRDELDYCLKRDIIRAIAIAFQGNSKGKLGSSTDCKIEYLPVILQPPEYPVCKRFLEDLLQLLKDLEIDHIFTHSDQQVYVHLCHIIWKEPTRY